MMICEGNAVGLKSCFVHASYQISRKHTNIGIIIYFSENSSFGLLHQIIHSPLVYKSLYILWTLLQVRCHLLCSGLCDWGCDSPRRCAPV